MVLDNMQSELEKLNAEITAILKQITPPPNPDEAARAQLSELELEAAAKMRVSPALYLQSKIKLQQERR